MSEGKKLHDPDKALNQAALLRFRQTMEIAPDRWKCAGHRGQAADEPATKPDQRVRAAAVHLTQIGSRWPQQGIGCVKRYERSKTQSEDPGINILEEINRDRNAQ
jgi:hypothetical protein